MRSITWDVGILAAAAILLAFSFLIRRHKALAALVSVYIAYIVTVSWGGVIVGLFQGDRVIFNQIWIKNHASPYMVQSITFVLLALLLMTFTKFVGKRSRYSLVEVTLYSVCAVALAAVFILAFLPADLRDKIVAGSKIVPYIYKWREWVVLAPVLIMVFFGIYSDEV